MTPGESPLAATAVWRGARLRRRAARAGPISPPPLPHPNPPRLYLKVRLRQRSGHVGAEVESRD